MFLNHEEIKKEKLIQNFVKPNFDNASYDLRVDKIITVDGKEKTEHEIMPNSMVFITSKERVMLSNNRIGHAFIKTRLSQKGIMANNIGIIDPQYDGHISTVLTNFGKNPYKLKEGEPFLRITISKFKTPEENIPLGFQPQSQKEYLTKVKALTMEYLDKYFINIDKVANGIEANVNRLHQETSKKRTENIGKWITRISFAIGVFAFAINTFSGSDKEEIKELKDEVKNMQETYFLDDVNKEKFSRKLDNLNEMDVHLYQQLESISLKLDSLNAKKK